MPTTEQTVQTTIEEWASIQGGPTTAGPSLAHYIVAKLAEARSSEP